MIVLRKHYSRWLLVILFAACFAPGCSCNAEPEKPPPPDRSALTKVLDATTGLVVSGVNSLHEFTGWLLNKSEVKVETIENKKEGDRYLAKVKITVRRGDETFSTETVGIEYDDMGIPTAQGSQQIKDAVERIKRDVLDKVQE